MSLSKVIQVWKGTLSMLSSRERLVFLFSWIKTFRRSVVVFLKYFWWLFLLDVGIRIMLEWHIQAGIYGTLITSFVAMLTIFFSILSIRSSVEVKNKAYFISRFKKIYGFGLIFFALMFLLQLTIAIGSGTPTWCGTFLKNWATSLSLYGVKLFAQSLITGLIFLSSFFLLDSRPKKLTASQAFTCAVKSLIYYLPLFAILALIYFVVYHLAFYLIYYLILLFKIRISGLILTMLINFFFICALNTLYLKIRHSNFKLFFEG